MAGNGYPENGNSDVPAHVAIIPDGNRRWARAKHLPVLAGYERGAEAVREVIETAHDLGIRWLSVWGSSLANLVERPPDEREALEATYERNFRRLAEDERVHRQRVRIRVLGEWEKLLGEKARRPIEVAIDRTKEYDRLNLNFLIAYDGKLELLRAIESIVDIARGNGHLAITSELVKNNLYTRDLPAVDLLVRTGGEAHLSAGFMLWEIGECQLYFSDKYWPDFTARDFETAVHDFQKRERRFAK